MKWYEWTANITLEWTSMTHYIFMALPVILLLLIFLLRNKISNISPKAKGIILTIMGLFVIGWELWFDVVEILHSAQSSSIGDAMFLQFKNGFSLCRLNMYVMGVFLVFRRMNMLKWILATALFGGYSTLIDHYTIGTSPSMHSIFTHSVILVSFIPFALAMKPSNYTVRSLIHTYLFNWTIVGVLLYTNHLWGVSNGELTSAALRTNMIVGWAYDIWKPLTLIAWVGVISIFAGVMFGLYRLIYWASIIKDESTSPTWIKIKTYTGAKGFRRSFESEEKAAWKSAAMNKLDKQAYTETTVEYKVKTKKGSK